MRVAAGRVGLLATALALAVVLLPQAAVAGAARTARPSPPPSVVPTLHRWSPSPGRFALRPGARIALAGHVARTDAVTFRDDVRAISGLDLRLASGSARPGDIVLSVGNAGLPPSGYSLQIGRTVRIEGEDEQGLFDGTQSVEQMLKAAGADETLPRGSGSDWPSVGTRGIMLDLSRHFQPLPYLMEQIRMAAWYKLDEVHLHLSDTQGYRLPSQAYPQLTAAQHYSPSDIAAIVRYARRYHVTLVPEVDVPAHASPMTAADPSLGWACSSIQDYTYWGVYVPGDNLNITAAGATQFVETLLTEVMRMFPDSPVIGIGGDEYASYGQQQSCPQLVDYAAAHGFATTEDVFTSWQNTIAGFLQAHGRQTEIWNWWDVVGHATVTPSRSDIVEPWHQDPPSYFDGPGGYKVISAPDDGTPDYFLYVAPGDPPGGPMVPEDVELYGSWHPVTGNAGLLGYESPLWAGPPPQPFSYDEWFSWTPWAVMADRTWGGRRLASVFDLEDVMDRVGSPPGIADDVPTGGRVLHGTPYGSSAVGPGHGPAMAFDGDPATSYQSSGDAGYAGIDLGAGRAARVTAIRYIPVQDPDPDSYAAGGLANSLDMVGGEFQGCSQGPASGCVDLATVRWRSTYDWHQLNVTGAGSYRWLRFVSAAGEPVDVSEIQFLTAPTGAQTVGVHPPSALTAGKAATVTAKVTNDGRSPARFAPQLTVTDTTDESTLPAHEEGRSAVWVAPGRSTTLRWRVQVPASATPGGYDVAVRAAIQAGRGGRASVGAVQAVAGTSLG